MSVVLEFDGLTFSTDTTKGLGLGRLIGWWDGPNPKDNAEDRPQGDGDYETVRTWRDGRGVTVEGDYVGTSIADAQAMRLRLAALQASGEPSQFRVADESGALSARMRLAGKVLLPDDLYQPFFTFSFQVASSLPYRYGDIVNVSTGLATRGTGISFPVTFPITFGEPGSTGRAVARNPGTADAYSTFSVAGGVMPGGFTVVHVESGRQIRIDRDLPAGSFVDLDSRRGTALLNGTSPIPGSLTRSEWWPVPRGGSATVQFLANGAASGTPTLTVGTAPASL